MGGKIKSSDGKRSGKCAAAVALVSAAAMAAGCGGGMQSLETKSITGYEPANVVTKTGYDVESLGGDRYRVTATGSQYTPVSRLEKIAHARAAEFGLEQQKKYFLATAPQSGIQCSQREYIERGKRKTLPASGFSVVTIEVNYANSPGDPAYRSTRDTARALKAELQSEVVAEDVKDASAVDIKAQCGT